MSKFKLLFCTFFFIFASINLYADDVKILIKIHNEIITNIDIKNEKKYLLFLNSKLIELSDERVNEIAKNSLIKEIIKRNELENYYDLEIQNDYLDSVEKNFLKKNGIKSKSQFVEFLKNKGLDYETIKNKLKIEAYWNQFIYNKYINNIKINKENLRLSVIAQYENKDKKFEYNLSEILFTETLNDSLEETLKKINNSININGFENTANILSVSNTSKNGGLIGWVNELQISEIIKKNIIDLDINQISKPIKIKGGYLIIKINDKREYKQKINIKQQIDELISKETNRQLNAFSNIFYKKLKKNILINEF